jgi:hypothetical protein
MKNRPWLLAIAGFLAIFIFALYWVVYSPNKTTQELDLWYVSSDFSQEIMEQLADRYNLQRSGNDFKLVLHSFETEDELAAAYGDSYPDLLLCSYSRAASLGEREQLKQIDGLSFNYLPEITAALPYAGSSFFPLGSAVPVVVYNTSLIPKPSENLEEFYQQANEYYTATSSPFYTCETALSMLSCWSAALGYEIKGDLAVDDLSEVFCSVYNAMAEQVMNGSFLPPTEQALSLVSQGLIPCAIVPSYRAVSMSKNLAVSALPAVEGGENAYTPDLIGLAVTGNNRYTDDSCKAFALWLRRYFSTMDALNLGLVPATANASGQSYSELDSLLLDVYTGTPVVYSPLGNFMQNREEMEAQIVRALDLLY